MLDELAAIRPDLTESLSVSYPDAQAAVLARLWGAFVREPLPDVVSRTVYGDLTSITLRSGQRFIGPTAAAEPFAVVSDSLRITYDGVQFQDPADLLGQLTLSGHSGQLRQEIAQSVAFLALARAAQPKRPGGEPSLTTLAGRADGLSILEQSIVDGHPLHPCCRTRDGMSIAEVLAYAPEHRPTVALEVYEVPARSWLSTGTGLPPRLPVHPWQRDHVLQAYPQLKRTGTTIATRPLMSLRTLATVNDPARHYKTAIDVQMTSAVRIVSPAAVRNGPIVSNLLSRLSADLGLTIWAEPAAGTVLGPDDEPIGGLAVSTRIATLPRHDEVILPIAALAAPSPADGRPLIREAVQLGYGGHPAGFLADLAALILPVLLTMLHRGVALEAHGQNLLVTLSHGRPVGLSYRDMGGLRISPERLSRHGMDAPPLYGDIANDDPAALRAKAFASGISVAIGEPLATLAREYEVDPEQLWRLVRERAEIVYSLLPPSAAADAQALFQRALPLKATTAMRLAENPIGDIWAEMANPLR